MIAHVLRDAPDWGNFTFEAFWGQSKVDTDLKIALFPWIQLWQKHLKPNFFQFRKRLAELSQFDTLPVDLRLNLSDLHTNRPALILLSDDDDWFDPAIVEILKTQYQQYPDIDVFSWNDALFITCPAFLGKDGPSIQIRTDQKLHTNNYCLTDKFLNRFQFRPASTVQEQSRVDRFDHSVMEKLRPELKIKHLPGIHSLTNKTIASQTAWKRGGKPNCECLTRSIKLCQNTDIIIPTEIRWATDQILNTMALYEEMQLLQIKML